MEQRHVLVWAAVDDEPIACLLQFKLCDEALHGLEQLVEERAILRTQVGEAGVGLCGYQQDVKHITRLGMLKSDEGWGFAQASHGYDKIRVGKNPPYGPAPKKGSSDAEQELFQRGAIPR